MKPFQDIIDKSNKIKAEKYKEPTLDTSPVTIIPPYSFKIYNIINPKHVTIVWVFAFAISIVMLVLSIWESYHKYVLYASIAAFSGTVLWYLYTKIWLFLSYSDYKNWPSKLNYTCTGWEELVSMPNFRDMEYWCNCKITFQTDRPHKEFAEVLEAANTIFCKTANDKYYQAFGIESRKEWNTENELNGSINCNVAGQLYWHLSKKLPAIVEYYKVQLSVKIQLTSESFKVTIDDTGSV